MTTTPYVLSGNSGGAILLPIIAVVLAAASAFANAWISVYCPIAGYVSILIVAQLAACTVIPLAYAGKLLKVRSTMLMRISGLTAGVAALYFAWACFIWVMARKDGGDVDLFQLIQAPTVIWDIAQAIAEEGWYSIRGLTPKGAVLWAFWAIEAGVVVWACIKFSTTRIQSTAFCEDCRQWMQSEPVVSIPADQGAIASTIKKHGLAGVQEVAPPSERAARWVNIVGQRCGNCKKSAVFSIQDVKLIKTEKGVKPEASELQPMHWQTEVEAAEIERIQHLLKAADAARFAAISAKPAAP